MDNRLVKLKKMLQPQNKNQEIKKNKKQKTKNKKKKLIFFMIELLFTLNYRLSL